MESLPDYMDEEKYSKEDLFKLYENMRVQLQQTVEKEDRWVCNLVILAYRIRYFPNTTKTKEENRKLEYNRLYQLLLNGHRSGPKIITAPYRGLEIKSAGDPDASYLTIGSWS